MKTQCLMVCALMAVCFGCAAQQDVRTLDSRTVSLERKYNDLQRKYASVEEQLASVGETSSEKNRNLRDQSATIRAEVRRIREDVQTLKGRVEETGYQSQKAFADLDKRLAAQEKRLAKMETYLDVRGDAASGKRPAAGIATAPPASEDVALYTQGKQAFDREDYDGARAAVTNLVQTHPKSNQGDNVQFWIGATY